MLYADIPDITSRCRSPPKNRRPRNPAQLHGKVFPMKRNPYGYPHKSKDLSKFASVEPAATRYDDLKGQRERLSKEIIITRSVAAFRQGRRKDSAWRGIGRGMSGKWVRPIRLHYPTCRLLFHTSKVPFFWNWSAQWRVMQPAWISPATG